MVETYDGWSIYNSQIKNQGQFILFLFIFANNNNKSCLYKYLIKVIYLHTVGENNIGAP